VFTDARPVASSGSSLALRKFVALTLFTLPLACTDMPGDGPVRTLALDQAGVEVGCTPRAALKWKIQRGASADRRGLRQPSDTECVVRLDLPAGTRLRFRVAAVKPAGGNNRRDINLAPEAGSKLRVRLSAATRSAASVDVLFERILTAEDATQRAEIELPRNAEEIRLDARRLDGGSATGPLAAEWSDLVLETRAELANDEGRPWREPLDEALQDFYLAEGWEPAPARPRQILVVGIDGVSWPLLEERIALGKLPTLARLRAAGYSGVLESTVIPESSMGWASMRTGVNAGRHGVFGFRFEDSSVPAYWRVLHAYGLRSIVVAVPDAPLRRPFTGVFVGGWTYSQFEDWVEPPALRRALQRAGYAPSLVKLRNADYYREKTRSRTDLTRSLLRHVAWDHAFVVFEYGDGAAHRLGLRSDGWAATLDEIDTQLDRLLAQVSAETTVLIVSDHGWKQYLGTVALEPWLSQNGFPGWKISMWAGDRVGIEPKTKLPPVMREKQRRRMIAALGALRQDPAGPKLVERVLPGEDVFEGPHASADRGLLIVELGGGFRAAKSMQQELVVARAASHHSSDGIYLLFGPNVRAGKGPTASILDVAPTVLNVLGVPIPATFEGRPIRDFGPPRLDRLAPASWQLDADPEDAEPLPEHLEESLRALGYIE
jgi:predicted AlkP superfamily phosphohydrolase/phosphomutase